MTSVARSTVDTGAVRGWVRPDGPPRTLLLHGGPGIGFDYLNSLLPELEGWTVAAFQQRGIAPSMLDGPFDIATAVADVVAVLDELGWHEGVYLLGHSWGGHLALHAAWRLGGRLAGVLAVDPSGVVGDGGGDEFEAELLRRLSPEDRARLEQIGEPEEDELAEEALRLLWPAYFSTLDAAPPFPSPALSQRAFLELHQDEEEQRTALEAALPSLTVPIGVVMGAASPMPLSVGSDVVGRVPGAWLDVVEGAGHFVWMEAPGAVRRGLDRLSER